MLIKCIITEFFRIADHFRKITVIHIPFPSLRCASPTQRGGSLNQNYYMRDTIIFLMAMPVSISATLQTEIIYKE
jgi:hypothetical protein